MESAIKIDCHCVTARADARVVNSAVVADIKSSIERMGLLNPILVRPKKIWVQTSWVDGYEILAGRHRHRAVVELGWSTIPARIIEADEVAAELAMISENLHRADLTVLERDQQVARWVELTGETIGATCTNSKPGPKGALRAAERELGIEHTNARRALKVASLSDDAKTTAVELGLDDNRAALLEAARVPKEKQAEYLRERAATVAQPESDAAQRDRFFKVWASLSDSVRQSVIPVIMATYAAA